MPAFSGPFSFRTLTTDIVTMIPKCMPVLFISHGSPMNAIEKNEFSDDWVTLNQHTPKPKAIIVFSAHWESQGTQITSALKPETVYDFGGFPATLYACRYPAQTDNTLIETITELLQQQGLTAIRNEHRGYDHGCWSVLNQLYPKAEIPVIQISLDINLKDLSSHYDVAQRLKPLREQGILFIGSGGIVHNIQKWMSMQAHDNIDWAIDFDEAVAQAVIKRDLHKLFNFQQLKGADDAVPTLEHYLPLIYCIGLTDEGDHIQFSTFTEHNLATACSRSIAFTRDKRLY